MKPLRISVTQMVSPSKNPKTLRYFRIFSSKIWKYQQFIEHLISSYGADGDDVVVPLADRRTRLSLDKEDNRAEPLAGNIKREPDTPDLITSDSCSTPPLLSMESRRPPQPPRTPPATPGGNLKSASKRARSDVQSLSNSRRSARLAATKNSAKSAKRVKGKSAAKARSPELKKRAKPKKAAPKRLLPASDFTPKVSMAAQQLPQVPEPQAIQSDPLPPSKNVIFHFFLADEKYGAVPQPLKNCETVHSFFDAALAAWGALVMSSAHQHQPQHHMMAAAQVVVEGFTRPIVVFWRNKEGFEAMMETVLKQAAVEGNQTELSLTVEVRCLLARE